MQIKKIYKDILPELLFDEVKEFGLKQGLSLGEAKINTYSLPDDSSSFLFRGTIIFKGHAKKGEVETENLRAHIQGFAKGETKLILDINTELFDQEKVTAFLNDLDFIFSSYEVKQAK